MFNRARRVYKCEQLSQNVDMDLPLSSFQASLIELALSSLNAERSILLMKRGTQGPLDTDMQSDTLRCSQNIQMCPKGLDSFTVPLDFFHVVRQSAIDSNLTTRESKLLFG